jgi:putative two-component system response regulator
LLPKVNVQANNPVIDLAIEIAGSHHEKWNGTGYPNGLVGEEIPLSGRIVAIADVYDALRSERPYKKPFSVEKSLDIISEDAGVHFDPAVVKAFFDSIEQICEIEAQLSDQPVEDSAPGVSFPAGNLPAPVSVAI